MENSFTSYSFGSGQSQPSSESIPLSRMVSQLVSRFQPFAVMRQSLIVNDIPKGFYVDTDENILATVIGHLFNTVIANTKSSCIRISAKRYGNIILIRISDPNGKMQSLSNQDWHALKAMAEKLGGCIIEDDIRRNSANITFSFRCLSNAA